MTFDFSIIPDLFEIKRDKQEEDLEDFSRIFPLLKPPAKRFGSMFAGGI